VGPTGSGKTTSLHSLLGHINAPERKIWTAEDPVEITQPGLRQVEVRPKIGFGFAEALRSFLRADPDVVMIGEMRDSETAEIAIHASLTGHLVLSTLHTNSAPETVVRLAQMGCDPFSFGDALLGILAQRLARRLCRDCRTLEPAVESDRARLQAALDLDGASEKVGHLVWRSRGCDACRGSGYSGRIAIHELLVVDEPLRAAIHEGAGADRIRQIAIAGGMKTMFQDGIQKCLTGETDLQQVLAICPVGRSLGRSSDESSGSPHPIVAEEEVECRPDLET
jgi:type II secretory ATPase GspE/PulE/Tfp pilus assembly ATPase PilB-like protein